MLGFCNFFRICGGMYEVWCEFLSRGVHGFSIGFSPVCGSSEGAKCGLSERDSCDTRGRDSPARFTGRFSSFFGTPGVPRQFGLA